MAKRVWTITLRDGNHTIELEHGVYSGKRHINVDGKTIESSSTGILDAGSEHHFQVSEVPCAIKIKSGFPSFRYELYVEGRPIGRKEAVHMSHRLGVLNIYFKAFFHLIGLFLVWGIVSGVAIAIIDITTGQIPSHQSIVVISVVLLLLGGLLYLKRRHRYFNVFRDVVSERTKVVGKVTRKWTKERDSQGEGATTQYLITVRRRTYSVSGRIYDWLWEGDMVTVNHWPHTKTVASVEKLDVLQSEIEMTEDAGDRLARDIADILHAKGLYAEPITSNQYARVPEFDWGVEDYSYEARVRLRGQDVDMLHVVAIPSKGIRNSEAVSYRAKILLESSKYQYLLQSRDSKDEALSVSFKAKGKVTTGHGGVSKFTWQSDTGTKLERRLVRVLNQDTSLGDTLVSSEHANVNVWLEEVDYISINTRKSYIEVRKIEEFLNSANLVAKILKEFK